MFARVCPLFVRYVFAEFGGLCSAIRTCVVDVVVENPAPLTVFFLKNCLCDVGVRIAQVNV